MQTKVLVKMQNQERCLERLMATVRESECQVRNLNARLSLDETVFFLTLEVEGERSAAELSSTLNAMSEVKSVETNPAA